MNIREKNRSPINKKKISITLMKTEALYQKDNILKN